MHRGRQRGSMMIEVLVSVVLLSISVLGLVRILGQSVKDSGELGYRSVAATMADEIVGRMWVMDPANYGTYAASMTGNTDQVPNGTRAVTVTGGNQVSVVVTWQAPGASAANACGVAGASSCYQMSATLAKNP
jgi:type IV pilus assembly protein PilV